ncbi:MAG: endonuclease/exonuclease/phosphatase family protein [Candidatus Sumerlaeia bacterium]|nr:endonuclease/exonuclease/phosphatase family protein [Candidatus Sumerlaeia bacterium]
MIRMLQLSFVLLLAAVVSGCGAARSMPAAAPGGLTVMVYNIRVGAGDGVLRQGEPHDETLREIARLIRSSGADVVLLQEVDNGVRRSGRTDQAALLAEATGMHAAFAEALELQGGSYGVAVLSRWPIEEHEVVRLPWIDYAARGEERPDWHSEPRVLQVARVAGPRGPMTVANTHLGLTAEQRALQTQAVADRLGPLVGQMPVLFGGDLNAQPEAEELAVLRTILTDAWEAVPTSRPESRFTFPSHDPNRTIDYLFASPAHFEFRDATVPATPLSDHRPIVARLRWKR